MNAVLTELVMPYAEFLGGDLKAPLPEASEQFDTTQWSDQGGGFTGRKHSEETLAKMRAGTPWNKGKSGMYSDETLKLMSEVQRGKHPLSDDNKTKLFNGAAEKYWNTPRHAAQLEALRLAKIGQPRSEETKAKISAALKGRKKK
jgi:NUMOD3 motif